MASAPAFELRDVSLWRWDSRVGVRRPILDGVEWRAETGELWALLGPNGAGKTTLLTVLAAVEFPSAGSVDVLGERLGRVEVFRLRERIGFVDARLGRRFAHALTVEQVVQTGGTGTIGLFEERLRSSDHDRARVLLGTMGIAHVAERRFADCSHGERTRALIARALVASPELLLLDEPASGLDLEGRETLLTAIGHVVAENQNLTVVLTTHHLEELPAATTHALLLRDGRVVATGVAGETLVPEQLSACFGLPVRVSRDEGRWRATSINLGHGDFL